MTFLPFFTIVSPVQDKELIIRLIALVGLVVWSVRSRRIPVAAPWLLIIAYVISYFTTYGSQMSYDCLINLSLPILFFFFYAGVDIRKRLVVLGCIISFYVLFVRAGLQLPWPPGIHHEFPMIGDKNTVGILLALIFPLCFKRPLAFTIITAGILFADSRSAMVAYLVVTTIYAIKNKKYLFFAIVAFILLLTFLNYGTGLGTKIANVISGAETRPQIWLKFLPLIGGTGMGNGFINQPFCHGGFKTVGPHNLSLFIATNGYWISLVIFIVIVYSRRFSVNRKSLLSYLIAAQFMDFELIGHLFFWILLAQDYKLERLTVPFKLTVPTVVLATVLAPIFVDWHLSHCLYQQPGETNEERFALLNSSIDLQKRFVRPRYERALWNIKFGNRELAIADLEVIGKYQPNYLDSRHLWVQLTRY